MEQITNRHNSKNGATRCSPLFYACRKRGRTNRKKAVSLCIVSVILLFTPIAGYGGNPAEPEALAGTAYAVTEDSVTDILPETVPLSNSPPFFAIPVPTATGEVSVRNDIAEIDLSNAKDGYVMVRYRKVTVKELRVIINGPGASPYIYRLRADGAYETFPFSDGSGHYRITVYENVFGNKYSSVISTTQDVQLSDEFAPFIRPNQYVNYNSSSSTTKKAAELTAGLATTTEKIAAIYHYVSTNISYDQQLADRIQAGYLPDVDKVLKKGKGICFDYAAVMTAMLRSQGIPAKLVIGYRGKAYHAWISAYSNEAGWVDGILYFKEKKWKLMDPTFASYIGSNSGTIKYAGDADSYSAKYFY